MEIKKLNNRPIRRTTRRDPSGFQLSRLELLRSILHGRRNKLRSTTFELLRASGFEPSWLRVRWTGGVGSFVIMRGNVLRVLVSATKSGLSDPTFQAYTIMPGVVDYVEIPGKRRGFRYGWCVEIHP